jgi:hypothetical protein
LRIIPAKLITKRKCYRTSNAICKGNQTPLFFFAVVKGALIKAIKEYLKVILDEKLDLLAFPFADRMKLSFMGTGCTIIFYIIGAALKLHLLGKHKEKITWETCIKCYDNSDSILTESVRLV